MPGNWMTSPAGELALGHFAGRRPAWLWTADGKELIWLNPAARLLGARSKRDSVKLQPVAIPIKGQIARLTRLGALGRSSLSRMPMTMGEKPLSLTCNCTLLPLDRDRHAMLVVGVDAVDRDLWAEYAFSDAVLADVIEPGMAFALFDSEGGLIAGEDGLSGMDGVSGGPSNERLVLVEAHELNERSAAKSEAPEALAKAPAEASADEHAEPQAASDAEETDEGEPQAETEAEAAAVTDTEAAADNEAEGETEAEFEGEVEVEADEAEPEPHPQSSALPPPETFKDLTSLLDRLNEDEKLFSPLGPQDDAVLYKDADTPWRDELPANDIMPPAPATTFAPQDAEREERAQTADPEPSPSVASEEKPGADRDEALWQITGMGFEPLSETGPSGGEGEHEDGLPEEDLSEEERARMEQVSRYNFAELSRILNDRIARERETPAAASQKPRSAEGGALVNLSDESLVLNRLPLGVLVFKDQKILFANRQMTELLGYRDTTTLRAQGLGAIFPRVSDNGDAVGPVTHLAHRSGTLIPVSARLQSITWQGAPSLMLTAATQTQAPGVEGIIRAFAEQLAALQGQGYFETSRAGILTSVSGRGADLFGRSPEALIGRPLMLLADHGDGAPLRDFLEREARKAETARPHLALRGTDPSLRILLFAEGQAGIVTGYFGIVQKFTETAPLAAPQAASPAPALDTATLTRLSRSVRRPLNTIIGFAELLRSNAFGPIENPRYTEYARDIKASGHEIVQAIDELEEYVRLDSGDYQIAPSEFDLTALLESCIVKVKGIAGAARVFVRSAIPENLPHIRADEASLGQAILNLLASAIDQTPAGGHVVLSAQIEEHGGVAVHVRDSGEGDNNHADKIVVFRDGSEDEAAQFRPRPSSVGLALTRSLLAINTCTLAIDPVSGHGTLFSLYIPSSLAAAAS